MSAASHGPARVGLAATEAFAFVTEVRDYAIYMIDGEGCILTWNEGARAIKGYTADQIVGQSFSLFFTEDDRARGRPERLLARAAVDGRVHDEAGGFEATGPASGPTSCSRPPTTTAGASAASSR